VRSPRATRRPRSVACNVGPGSRGMGGRFVRVLLWDVRVGGPRRLPLIERVAADLLLLLGVSHASSRAWSRRWSGRYHTVAGLELTRSEQQRPHGARIASRWPIRRAELVGGLTPAERCPGCRRSPRW
jgi:hypothetical protein